MTQDSTSGRAHVGSITRILVLCAGVYFANEFAWKALDLVGPAAANPVVLLVRAIFTVGCVLGAYAALVYLLERRRPQELDFRGMVGMMYGFLSGGLLVLLSLGLISLFASVEVSFIGFDLPVFSVLVQTMTVGILEETLFRCSLQRSAEHAFGARVALPASALIFGIAHMGNAGATPWSVFCVAVGGLLLGLAFMLSRNLWLPAGLHAGWNFAQAGLFGIAVSGRSLPGMLETSVAGSVAVTGGRFGIEASVITLFVLIGSCITFGLLLRRKALSQRAGHREPVLD